MSFAEIATVADLTYYPDTEPGISRRRAGRGFTYRAPDGTRIDNADARARIAALAVPPAYDDVWISPLVRGHLQATGHDDRGRKQYRYHADWTDHHARLKFDKLTGFADTLPTLRRWITTRLAGEVGARDTAIAATLALIDRVSLRVGNSVYTQENGTFGATTMLREHGDFSNDRVTLQYVGKGRAAIRKDFYAPRLSAVLEACQDLPGAEIITWTDADGIGHAVRSEQINDVLHDLCGEGVSAKTMRTWNGTLAAFQAALTDDDLTIKAMTTAAATALHNTPTVARNSYIHPAVIELASLTTADRTAVLAHSARAAPQSGLRAGEAALANFLRCG